MGASQYLCLTSEENKDSPPSPKRHRSELRKVSKTGSTRFLEVSQYMHPMFATAEG